MARQRRSRSCSMKGSSGTLTLALTLSLACSMKGSSGTAFHAAWAPLRSCSKVVG